MANKRLKKKQAKKQVIQTVERAGVKQKEIKRLSVTELTKIAKKQTTKEKRREREQARYNQLIKAGIAPKDARKMRSWSEKRIGDQLDQLAKAKAKKKRKPASQKEKLVLFWTDVTEITDRELPPQLREYARSLSADELKREIKVMMYQNSGEIGSYQIHLLENTKGMDFFYSDQAKIYEGQAKSYKILLEVIHVMMNLLYAGMEKYMFINEFAQHVSFFSKRNAARIIDELDVQKGEW